MSIYSTKLAFKRDLGSHLSFLFFSAIYFTHDNNCPFILSSFLINSKDAILLLVLVSDPVL